MQRRVLLSSAAAAALAAALTACGKKEPAASAAAASSAASGELRPITIGVTAGTSEEVAEVVTKEAEKAGLKVTVKVFGDYQTPDAALASGEIDANSYQHEPFLQAYNANNKTDLVVAGKTYLAPLSTRRRSREPLKSRTARRSPFRMIRRTAAARFSSSRSRAGLN